MWTSPTKNTQLPPIIEMKPKKDHLLSKVFPLSVDNIHMNVAGASSLSDGLAILATNMQSQKLPQQLGFAILKQLQNTQEMQVQALVSMINSTSGLTADGTGQIVNVGA